MLLKPAADLNNAKVSLNRTRELVKQGVFRPKPWTMRKRNTRAANRRVASLQRTLDLAVLGPRREQRDQIIGQINQAKGLVAYAQTQLDNTVIKAPVSGTILDRNVEKGEFVTTGFVGDKGAKGYLVTMADLNYLQVELDISQNDFPKLGPQQKGSHHDRCLPGSPLSRIRRASFAGSGPCESNSTGQSSRAEPGSVSPAGHERDCQLLQRTESR